MHLERTKCSFRDANFSARGAEGSRRQAADREASSCNAAQLPRFLVIIVIIIINLVTTLIKTFPFILEIK